MPAKGVTSNSESCLHDRGPDKHKNNTRQHPTSLGNSTGRERHGDGGEHALVYGEQEIGESRGPHGRVGQHTPEPEVGQVPDEGTRGVRKCQRVAPEEPLEACDGRCHYRKPDQ